jgi:hypothetical protein
MILDTERHLFIPELVKEFDMLYEDQNQKNMMEGKVKDTWGWNIKISMKITGISEDYKLLLNFNEWKYVDFIIFGSNTDYLAQLFNVSSDNKEKNKVKISSLQYQFHKDIDYIKGEIARISKMLETQMP